LAIARDYDEISTSAAVSLVKQSGHGIESFPPTDIKLKHSLPSEGTAQLSHSVRQFPVLLMVEVKGLVGSVIAQQEHIATPKGHESKNNNLKVQQALRCDEIIDAKASTDIGQHSDTSLPIIVVVQGQPELAIAAVHGSHSVRGHCKTVGSEVNCERSLVMQSPYKLGKVRKAPRLATAKSNFENASIRDLLEKAERGIRGPSAFRGKVPGAERARQVTLIGNCELHNTGRFLTKVSRLLAVTQNVRS
jgi:hypothetical protein